MIKKLVMEKLLYSELGYLEDVRAWDLEQQVREKRRKKIRKKKKKRKLREKYASKGKW